MDRKSSSLYQNAAIPKRIPDDWDRQVYRKLKRDSLFSVEDKKQTTQPPKYRARLRGSIRSTRTYNAFDLDTEESQASTKGGEDRLFSSQEEKLFDDFRFKAPGGVDDLPRYFREKLRVRKSNALRDSKGDVTKSPVSVIDQARAVLEDDTSDITDEDDFEEYEVGIEFGDEDFDDDVESEEEHSDVEDDVELVVPLKEENFDTYKRFKFSKGDKRKSYMLLDNVWDPFAETRSGCAGEASSGDEESNETEI